MTGSLTVNFYTSTMYTAIYLAWLKNVTMLPRKSRITFAHLDSIFGYAGPILAS